MEKQIGGFMAELNYETDKIHYLELTSTVNKLQLSEKKINGVDVVLYPENDFEGSGGFVEKFVQRKMLKYNQIKIKAYNNKMKKLLKRGAKKKGSN